eukprot:TRINITY_DN7137_c0_g1_i1.p1 TRINITY_DN7137_c0_g1~~TRINITY_DN7137_c0_g1_i1.p1  ORF type:complete len:475 (+),score=80.80 TRINITY_DN7137_c0_g1_i1:113-1426(+)
MDAKEEALPQMRGEFLFPKQPATGKPYVYMCGNSLGLQPVAAQKWVQHELSHWATYGVEGHFTPSLIDKGTEEEREVQPWLHYDNNVIPSLAKIVGASHKEIGVMNGLTVNIHLMFVPFYRPTATRNKILIESKPFPSDLYALQSQIKFHGYNPETSIVALQPRQGEPCLRTEDIVAAIEKEKDSLALVFFAGVQYYTGQFFDIPQITAAAHRHGITVGFDLAHAVGNVPLQLHDWDVDFAVWCSYKYLNAGPGAIAGCFVHERLGKHKHLPQFAGWFGQNIETRFDMCQPWDPEEGAGGFKLSNTPVMPTALLAASLSVFDKAGGMAAVRRKSELLTAYAELLLHLELTPQEFTILTPADITARGAQLSVLMKVDAGTVSKHLLKLGAICDVRKPDVMRIAPVALYNSFEDVLVFIRLFKEAVHLTANNNTKEVSI